MQISLRVQPPRRLIWPISVSLFLASRNTTAPTYHEGAGVSKFQTQLISISKGKCLLYTYDKGLSAGGVEQGLEKG